MIPAIARSKLDLPDPFGPIMESQSPEFTLNETLLTTFFPPSSTSSP
jgi:hypothetical protein